MADTIDSDEEVKKSDDSQENQESEVEEQENQEENQEEKTEIPDDYEPPVRKTPLDYIKERKQKRSQESKQEEGAQEEVELSPEAQRALDARLKPVEDYFNEKEIQNDIRYFLGDAENKEFKPYSKLAEKFMKKHPTITVEQAFLLASKDDLMAIGAKRAKEAEIKAKKNNIKGSTQRSLEKKPLEYKELNEILKTKGKIDFENL